MGIELGWGTIATELAVAQTSAVERARAMGAGGRNASMAGRGGDVVVVVGGQSWRLGAVNAPQQAADTVCSCSIQGRARMQAEWGEGWREGSRWRGRGWVVLACRGAIRCVSW